MKNPSVKNPSVIKAISPELSLEIESMITKIHDAFNLNLFKIQASKLVAWKSKNSTLQLTEKRLIEILGGEI